MSGSGRRTGWRGAPPAVGERRQDLGQLGRQLGRQAVGVDHVLRGHVRVECVDEDLVRHLSLELGRRAREHGIPALLGAAAQMAQEVGLPDPGLAADRDAARAALTQRV